MCGLCGEIRFDNRPASTDLVRRMTGRMTPRGPDSGGLFAQGPVALGHRRLKIIDQSEAAQQPMVDPELGLSIVYNGAIYNYPELRRELEGKGYRFFSTGDTEVILKAYHAWGADCVKRLNGMFAFAIWERDTRRALLARDRLGIKPLYLAATPGALRFASTLPALLASDRVDRSLDPVALNHYLSFHSVVPAPRTLIKGVRKLPPGTTLRIEPDGRMTEERYWDLRFAAAEGDERLGEADWEARVLDALRTAVKRRLVADTPVGVLLSGGLDSSLIVGLLAEAGQSGLNTFSVGFESVGGEAGDEFQYSDIVANRFETRHHRIAVDSGAALDALPSAIHAMSEPMMSHDNVGFHLLSREVAKHVKVVQSGQGADEVFAGYHWYPPMVDSTDAVDDYARVFFDRDFDEYRRMVVPELADGDHAREFVAERFADGAAERPVDKALHIDSTVMLVDDPVKRVDNQTMAYGLEARVPFLDHELVELAARVPAELKVRGEGKHVLKEAARKVIPAEVIDRPKGYFPVPALKYLRGPYLDFVRLVLEQPAARERGIYKREYVDSLLQDPDSHITPLRGSKLWQVAVLESWMQAHGV